MSDESAVTLSQGLPETVLPAPPQEWQDALALALAVEGSAHKAAVAARRRFSPPLPRSVGSAGGAG